MARENKPESTGRDLSDIVSVIGPGMEIVGDVKSDGTVRVEGHVEGSIKAGKSVVIGKDGVVDGDIETQDVVVAGRVTGTINADSRVELQDSCRVEGDIRSRRVKLDEGGRVEGRLHMGSEAVGGSVRPEKAAVSGRPGEAAVARSGAQSASAPSGGAGTSSSASPAKTSGGGGGGESAGESGKG